MNDGPSPRRDLERVDNLVDHVLAAVARRAGLGGSAVLMTDWVTIAGEGWGKATPLRVEAGTLHVAVPDGMTATRLRHATGPLLERIRQRVGEGLVSSVRVHVRRPGRAS